MRAVSCFLSQADQVFLPIVGALAVDGLGVVSGAAREVGRHWGARCRAGCGTGCRRRRHPRTAPTAAQPSDIFLGQHLAAIHRLLGILKRLGHPNVHAEIEVAQHEHRRLQALGQVEGLASRTRSTPSCCRAAGRSGACRRGPGNSISMSPWRRAWAGRCSGPCAGCPR